jgi:hypothetical protein
LRLASPQYRQRREISTVVVEAVDADLETTLLELVDEPRIDVVTILRDEVPGRTISRVDFELEQPSQVSVAGDALDVMRQHERPR